MILIDALVRELFIIKRERERDNNNKKKSKFGCPFRFQEDEEEAIVSRRFIMANWPLKEKKRKEKRFSISFLSCSSILWSF